MSILYVFVHIPKTAGEAFKRNIEHSLPRGRFLRSSFSYFEPYFDTRKQGMEFFRGHNYFHDYVRSLSPAERNKIQCVGGHDSYFGIHTLFDKPTRYITFLREPIQRTLSLYNFERMAWERRCHQRDHLNVFDEGFLKRMSDHFLVEGKVPSFDAWLEQVYGRHTAFYYSMSDFLRNLGFQNGLDPFHFVGITENYEKDALHLYDTLGITRFDADRNASKPYVRLGEPAPRYSRKNKKVQRRRPGALSFGGREKPTFQSQSPALLQAILICLGSQLIALARRHEALPSTAAILVRRSPTVCFSSVGSKNLPTIV